MNCRPRCHTIYRCSRRRRTQFIDWIEIVLHIGAPDRILVVFGRRTGCAVCRKGNGPGTDGERKIRKIHPHKHGAHGQSGFPLCGPQVRGAERIQVSRLTYSRIGDRMPNPCAGGVSYERQPRARLKTESVCGHESTIAGDPALRAPVFR